MVRQATCACTRACLELGSALDGCGRRKGRRRWGSMQLEEGSIVGTMGLHALRTMQGKNGVQLVQIVEGEQQNLKQEAQDGPARHRPQTYF
eukprot:1152957-Pelagomonas_calceolata.AAC.5